MTPKTFDDLRDFRDQSLRQRKLFSQEPAIQPSQIWELAATTFAYVSSLPDSELRNIRRHTYHITSDIYLKYLYFSEKSRSEHQADYRWLANRLQCTPTEGESGIGFDFGQRSRTQQDITRM